MKTPRLRRSVSFLSAFVMIGAMASLTPVFGAGPPSALDVNVVNPPSSPVPVTMQGTGAVSGSVAVTNTSANPVPVAVQGSSSVTGSVTVANTAANPVPVTGTVGISGTPSVNVVGGLSTTSGDHTSLVTSGDVVVANEFTDLISFADLTQYKTVKLVVTCFEAACSNLTVRVFEIPSGSMQIDGFAIPGSSLATVRFYDLPGSNFSVDVLNSSPTTTPTLHFMLLGRSN